VYLAPVPTDANQFLAPVPTDASQSSAPVPTDASQFSAPVPTDAEEVQVEIPQTRLVAILEQQTKELQGAYWRNGRLESQVEELQKIVQFQEEQLREHMKLLTDSQHKPGWWAKFSTWFFKIQ
jgi:hypothetical protein